MLWSCTTRCIIKSLIWVFWLLQAKYFAKARRNDLRRWNGFGFGNGCQSFLVNYFKMERKLLRTEFSPKGFWKGLPAVKRLAKEAGVPEDDTKLWLMKQATRQIYLPALKHIPGPTFGVVDVTSRFKVSRAFQKISKRGPLRWPKVLQVDPWREFVDDVTREMTKHDVRIRRGNVNNSIELWVNASSLSTTVKRSTLGRERDRQNGWRGFQKLFQVWIVKWPGWLERDLSMQSTKSRFTQRVKPPIQDLLAWKIREETLQRMWSTSLKLVSWKVVKKRATDHVWSLKVHGIERSTVNKG